jgi:hypothetical protein
VKNEEKNLMRITRTPTFAAPIEKQGKRKRKEREKEDKIKVV